MTAGEDSSAASLFPPRPGTVYGALRSAYIHEHSDFDTFAKAGDDAVREWMGTPDEVGRFRIQGVFLQDERGIVTAAPLDVEVQTSDSGEAASRLKLVEIPETQTYSLTGVSKEKTTSPVGGYVYVHDLKRSMLPEAPAQMPIFRLSHWLNYEPKIGIAIDRERKQAMDKFLYQIDMQRLVAPTGDQAMVRQLPECSPGLSVYCVDAPDFSKIRVISMGGEQRPWWLKHESEKLELYSEEEMSLVIRGIQQNEMARLVLLSPAIWSRGTWDTERRVLQLEGMELPILASAVGRPEVIGGWDIQKNRPKERQLALPAGSVFYVRVQRDMADTFVRAVCGTNHSDSLIHEGYGLLMPGVVESTIVQRVHKETERS